ncbi:MAG: TonB-dependent receptor plug domain-containing protein, partial [Verrucomicrobia bacterium]|nr:TonB-dependent receptor plug domain-containing protein [Verrucomicrobiota bacterium]
MATTLRGALARALAIASVFTCVADLGRAQAVQNPTAPAAAPTAKSPEASLPVVELSPFEVRAEADVGYQAANTTSGSRLNSRLRDTPAAVSAFTPEFLADIAATNLEEMLGHATNIEIDVEDANAGFNNPQGRGADGNDYQFRMRGSPAGASREFVESSIPVDLYNVERAEVASGPNSILFGLGQAGGLVSLSGKKANLHRSRATLKTMFGSWSYERYEGDYNRVLIPKKLSLRLLGLYQNNQGWRYWDFNDQARWTAAVAYQPFKNTTVHVSFEKGHMDNNLTIGWNATDQVTAWQDGGRRVFDGTAVPAGSGTARFNANNNRFTFNQQDGVVYNLRGEFQSTG